MIGGPAWSLAAAIVILLAIYGADFMAKEKSETTDIDVKTGRGDDKIDLGRSLGGKVHVAFCQS